MDVFKYYPEERRNIRDEFSIASDVKLIGHVGRFDEQKNHMFLLDVFQKIHQKDSNTKLMLVGKGALEEKIRNRAKELGVYDSVIFTGVRSDVPQILSAMDVFVLPSFYEGMPNTIIESQATGLPCVIADTITKEANITGLVEYLPLGNSDAWAEKALSIINTERVDTKDSFVLNRYDIKSVVEDFSRSIFDFQ